MNSNFIGYKFVGTFQMTTSIPSPTLVPPHAPTDIVIRDATPCWVTKQLALREDGVIYEITFDAYGELTCRRVGDLPNE